MDAAANLLQDHRFVGTLIDSLPCGFMVLDEDGRVQAMNNVMERVLGITKQTAVGKKKGEVLRCIHLFESTVGCGYTEDCSDCETRKLALSALSKNRKQTARTYLQLLIDGQLRNLTLLLSAVPFNFADQRSVILLIEDISKLATMSPSDHENGFRGIVGRDEKMQEVFDTIRQVARTNAPVLLQGESGTGKELVALAIHKESSRANNYFVPVNCGALPQGLVETELFGHVKGAFTGAIHDKKGRFELADQGTIFLDEVNELNPATQVKLLRVLQSGNIMRVGSERMVRLDTRVISATNTTLEEEVAAGRFREDLYYRLCVVPITLPPLRERKGDIPLLSEHFLAQFAGEPGFRKVTLSSEALSVLMVYKWPGNVRELQNVLKLAIIQCPGDVIEPEYLSITPSGLSPKRYRTSKLREQKVTRAMQKAGGNKSRAAELLDVSRSSLYRYFDRQKEIM